MTPGIWNTVKGRLLFFLLLSSIVPLALVGTVTYSTLQSFLENKLKSGVQESLDKERIGLDNIIKNMNFSSQQLALDQNLTRAMFRFYKSENLIEKGEILPVLKERMTLLNYTSPHTGIITLLDEQQQPFLQSYPTSSVIQWDKFPTLLQANGVLYQAPHPTVDQYDDRSQVFSLVRQIKDYNSNESIYLYMESNFQSLLRLFGTEQYGEPVHHLIVNADNRVVFSENPHAFPVGSPYVPVRSGNTVSGLLQFVTESEQGWKMIVVMKGDAFQKSITEWFWKVVSIAFVSLAISGLLAFIAWRTVYRPLHVLNKEIMRMENAHTNRSRVMLHLKEFDEVLQRFYLMRTHVFNLLKEIEEREQAKSQVEVEKLRFQINPHFIHNTLNTVQVIAKVNRQPEIVQLITYFTRILHYNLGKEGSHVQVKDEIANLQDYLNLQQIRYSHTFEVSVDVAPEVEHFPVPRFMLQPLVENAIYHGFSSRDGSISVKVHPHPQGGIFIHVEDNGEGIEEERLSALLEPKDQLARKTGMGIGLNFVNRLIQTYYGQAYGLQITSVPGEGTSIAIHIPFEWQGGSSHDQNHSGR